MYNILILGSGGREHALSWKISQSPKCRNLYIAPGNGGTQETGTNLQVDIMDFGAVEKLVDKYEINYLVVGPEAPLVAGIYDYFKDHSVNVIGPSAKAALLEGSKDFANRFMKEFEIPTAAYLTITKDNIEEAERFIDSQPGKIVLKADGLAAGKGVLIIDDRVEAKKALKTMLDGQFGEASSKVVIEEFLDGREFSVFILTDGDQYQILPVAKDYKRVGESDTGLNTGGMGAVSPVPFVDDRMITKVQERIIEPTIRGLMERNYVYQGFLFLGLISVNDDPFVIEYNCRLGDPESEVVLPRLKTDLLDLFEALTKGNLDSTRVEFTSGAAATIMLVSGGYPEAYEKNKTISIGDVNDSILFHAGTREEDGRLLTSGGRVIAVTSLSNDIPTALEKSRNSISEIHFENMQFRRDIGFDL